MVLTLEEVRLIRESQDIKIKENWNGRKASISLLEQTCFDRVIQHCLNHQESYAYKLNHYIIQNPNQFLEVSCMYF